MAYFNYHKINCDTEHSLQNPEGNLAPSVSSRNLVRKDLELKTCFQCCLFIISSGWILDSVRTFKNALSSCRHSAMKDDVVDPFHYFRTRARDMRQHLNSTSFIDKGNGGCGHQPSVNHLTNLPEYNTNKPSVHFRQTSHRE